MPREKILRACDTIEAELEERVKYFKGEDKLLEAQRIAERTNFDIEMLKETGFCSGIENYSRHLSGQPAGSRPLTLIDYFPDDFLIMVDAVSYTHLRQRKDMVPVQQDSEANGFRRKGSGIEDEIYEMR